MSLHQALFACGFGNRDLFDGKNVAERISEEVFDDIFYLMMVISWESVEDPFA